MKRLNILFLLLLSTIIAVFVSCQSVRNVKLPAQIISFSEIKTKGKICTGNKKNDNDIFVSVLSISDFKYELIIPQGEFTEKINIYYKNIIYPIKITYTKVLDKRWDGQVYSNIKIKNLPKNYSINTLEPVGFKYIINEAKFSMFATKDMFPLYISSFQLNNKIFHVYLSEFYDDAGHSLLSYIRYKNQKYWIVDEAGNEYASFTKSDFKICDQPDSESYDFIPLIAAYSYIFSFVR